MYFKLLSLFLILTIFNNVQAALLDKECYEKGLVVENTLKSLLLLNNRFTKFETKNDVKPYCETARNLIKEVKAFRKTNCLNGLSKQVLNIVLPRFVAFVKTKCTEKGMSETFELVKCANDRNKAQINVCFQDYSSVIRYTADSVEDPSKVLSLLCCNYHRVLRCLGSDKLKDCGGLNTGKYAHDLIQQFLSDLFNLMCGKFTPDFCKTEGLDKELNTIKGNGKIDKEFLIIPALKVADKLSNF